MRERLGKFALSLHPEKTKNPNASVKREAEEDWGRAKTPEPQLHGPGLLTGSARGMGVLRRASESIADPFACEIKFRHASYPHCLYPAFPASRGSYNQDRIDRRTTAWTSF
jgi:hypothetical protein